LPEDEGGRQEGEDAGGGERAPAPPGGLARFLQSRGTRWGTATAVYVVVVAAVLVAVNLVASRVTAQWDVTAGHQLTLSAASRRIAAAVPRPVHIIAFEQPGDPTGAEVQALLTQYAQASRGRITYQVIDPVTHNGLAARYGVTAYNTVVVQAGPNVQTVLPSDMTTYNAAGTPVFSGEEAITNAILRAGAGPPMKVDWLEGDGEPDITAGQRPDATQALRNAGYTVGTLNLLTTNGVPPDVAAVVIDGPTHDLAAGEVAALEAYARRGGHFVVLLGPTAKPLPHLDALLTSWGITPQNDVVVDLGQHYQADPTMLVPRYAGSSITAPIAAANLATLLPGSQGLTLGKPKGYTVAPVLTTSAGTASGHPLSWGMTDLSAILRGQITYTPGKDIPGPVTVAATSALAKPPAVAGAESSLPASGAPGFRAVVFGNDIFLSSGTSTGGSAFISVQGNRDLLLNAVGWATGRAQGITVRPNPGLDTQVFLTGSTTRSLTLTFIVGVPLVCFLLAFGTWVSRRRL
jgi:ABC-type uncharacterized transport system involved in gliding motility auxiliary subunit